MLEDLSYAVRFGTARCGDQDEENKTYDYSAS